MPTTKKSLESKYTHIVIGGGSSGCVIAARLAENPSFNILLIEAGHDYGTMDKLPADIVDATVPSQRAHDWGIEASGNGSRSIAMIRGKVMGGSSAVNACIALRAEPGDFEAWSVSGDETWSWDSVLPYYKKLESDLDFPSSEFHGNDGPLRIRRWKQSELYPLSAAMIEASAGAGFETIVDHNLPGSTGCGPLPMNAIDGRRISTADAYLNPVRSHSNLTIVSDSVVDRILFEDQKAVGVSTATPNGTQTFYGSNIILSAGAFGTPAILMRSGIGPAPDLEDLKIPLAVDLPGVGANLSDHSQVPIGIVAKNGYADDGKPPCIQVLLRYSSSQSEQTNDMQVCLLNQVEVNVFAPYLLEASSGKSLFFLTSNLMLPESRGRVSLKSADPRDNPLVELNFCAAEADMQRHRNGLRLACSLLKEPALAYLTAEVLESDSLSGTDSELNEFILKRVQTAHHPCGTARMGSASDPMSVVDTNCRVIGVEGLYVADASIIPVPIRANTNLTCIMIGERMAAMLTAGSIKSNKK